MKQNDTSKVRVVAEIDQELAALLDAECKEKGDCSRASIIRAALQERYKLVVAP